jgi:hypothetical protein
MSQMKRFYYAVMVAGILCIVFIFSPNIYAAEKNPCSKDIARFCKNVNPDNDGILRCLEEHARELSKACKDYEGQLEDVKGTDGKVVRAKTRKTKFPY